MDTALGAAVRPAAAQPLWLGLEMQNALDQHPVLFKSRDLAAYPDNLYFSRGVRPLTVGLTATYSY